VARGSRLRGAIGIGFRCCACSRGAPNFAHAAPEGTPHPRVPQAHGPLSVLNSVKIILRPGTSTIIGNATENSSRESGARPTSLARGAQRGRPVSRSTHSLREQSRAMLRGPEMSTRGCRSVASDSAAHHVLPMHDRATHDTTERFRVELQLEHNRTAHQYSSRATSLHRAPVRYAAIRDAAG
jgi:hypothetical protein